MPSQRDIARHIPAGSSTVHFPDVDAVAYVVPAGSIEGGTTSPHKPKAIGYHGNCRRHDFYLRFDNSEQLDAYLDRWTEGLRAARERREQRAAERRAATAAGHSVQVGDVFVYRWGYEQTNVEFLEVVGITRTAVKVRYIDKQVVAETGTMSRTVRPVPGAFQQNSEVLTRRVKVFDHAGGNPRPYFSMDHGSALLDNGDPVHESWYG